MQNLYKTQCSTKNLMKGGGVIFFLLLNGCQSALNLAC
jgi:hypothetical protein